MHKSRIKLAGLLLVTLVSFASAQHNILFENFTGTAFPPVSWTVYNFDGGTQMWSRYTTNPYSPPACASCYYESPSLKNNDWLITPRIGPIQISDSIIFYYRANTPSYFETLLVRVSTNPSASDTAQYDIISVISTNINFYSRMALDLSAYAGNQVYIAFQYSCLNKSRIYIDDVTVISYHIYTNDVGVQSIISPGAAISMRSSVVTPRALVKNFGTNPQSNFPVRCSILGANGVLRYADQQMVSSLAAGDSLTVSFTNWTPTIVESCIVKMRTFLPGDEYSVNDSQGRITQVVRAYYTGGPDAGYLWWIDSDTAGGPIYNWRDISNTGRTVPFASFDDDFAKIPIGFTYNFYGSNYDSLYVGTNGFISFNAGYYNLTNDSVPTVGVPNNAIYALWDDLYCIASGRVLYQKLGTSPNCTLVVSYDNIRYHGGGDSTLTFQILLMQGTNDIILQYNDVITRTNYLDRDTGRSATIGTENSTGTAGLCYIYNARPYGNLLSAGRAIRFYFSQVNNDVGVDAIIYPIATHQVYTNMIPIARVKNYGILIQNNFPVVCSIFGTGGVLRYANTQTVASLTPGETTRVNFASWTPTDTGICTIKMKTQLIGDECSANDQKTRNTEITPFLLLERFNDELFPPSGWRNIAIQDTFRWGRRTICINPNCGPYEGAAMANYQSYYAPLGSQARLISPPILLGTTPLSCTLKFWMYHDWSMSTVPDSVKVEYSTNGTNFIRVAAFRRYDPNTSWVEHSVYLGTFSGTIYFGFLAYSGYGNNMNIDYVRLIGNPGTPPPVNDIGVNSIIYPTGSQRVNITTQPICLVKNFGSTVQTYFPVVCSIIGAGSVLRYTNTQIVATLAPDDTIRVNFADWTPTVTELCTVKMRTALIGDQDSTNDQKTRRTQITAMFLAEGFNGTTFPPAEWQNVIIQGSYIWERKISNTYPACVPYEGEAMTSYQSYYAPLGSRARLISPPIMFGISPMLCTLKFWMYHDPGYPSDPDSIKIEYSVDGINFTRVTALRRYEPGTPAWIEHSVYLGTFTGIIYVSFLGYSGYGDNMNIDNVRLVGPLETPPPANDVGVDAIIYPTLVHNVNIPMVPTARIKNFGTVAQTNFAVTCSIFGANDTLRYNDTKIIASLTPNDTARVNFVSWTPTVAELCTVKMRTNLSGDQDSTNDQRTRAIEIAAFRLVEGFNDTVYPPPGWCRRMISGNYFWERKFSNINPVCFPYEGAAMVSYQSYGTPQGSQTRLISPQIALGTTPVPCTLKFCMFHDPDFSWRVDSVKIEYSTDSINFTQVASFSRYRPGTVGWAEHTVYLGTFSGMINVGLLAFSGFGNNMNVDYVRLYAPGSGIEEGVVTNLSLITMLYPPRPNPINNIAKISFSLSEPQKVLLRIYDTSGRLIKTLVDTRLAYGNYNYTWDGKDKQNHNVAEGVYFCTLETLKQNFTRKMIFAR